MLDKDKYFIKSYLTLIHISVTDKDNIQVIFNRDITMNEDEAINECKNSVGVISQRTIVANHPWVTDADEELKQLEEESAGDIQSAKQSLEGDGHGTE